MAGHRDDLSPADRHKRVEQLLVPGAIIHLFCPFTDPPKNKFAVFVGRDGETCLLLFINSKRPPIPYLDRYQVMVHRADYGWLRRDSYLDCAQIIDQMSFAEVCAQLARGLAQFKGNLTNDTRLQVIEMVQSALTIMDWHKGIVSEALSGAPSGE